MKSRRSFFKRALLRTATWAALTTAASTGLLASSAWAQTASNPKVAADLRGYVQISASGGVLPAVIWRSEEHTSELQSQ